MRLSLVPAYQQCSAPNRTHGTPLDSPSCGPPVRESTSLTLGTPDANGRPTKSTGFVRLRVLTGDPSTPPDEADVQLTLDITDVRRQSDLTDYTGEVEVDSTLQITDRWNGATSSGGSQSATAIAIPFVFPTTCAATVDPDLGATCGTTTTFEAMVPGGVPEGKRAIWQLGQFSVQDGGADGDIDTAPNAVFARQGVFVP